MTDANTLGSFNLAYSTFEQVLDIYNFIPEIYVINLCTPILSPCHFIYEETGI